jgi:aryl-alcohol dehydrogenase-like predicted oxidoreductase
MGTEKLILGTVQFGLHYGINNQLGQPPKSEIFSLLNKAYEHGIRSLDTASSYGDSEKNIGEYLAENAKENRKVNFKVITKLDLKSNSWRTSLQNSLNLLGLEKIDTLLFHSFQDYENNIELFEKEILREKGTLFNKVGVSVYENSELLALSNMDNIDVIQCPFNLLDNHTVKGQLLDGLNKKGIEVHTRSCFLQGLFFKPIANLPSYLLPLATYLQTINRISKENKIEVGHLAVQYALSKPYIAGVLFGVDSIAQLMKNIAWAEQLIDTDILAQIDQIEIIDKALLNPSKWKM